MADVDKLKNLEKSYDKLLIDLAEKEKLIILLTQKINEMQKQVENIADSVRDEYLHSSDWVKNALEKVVYFSAIELQHAGLDIFFHKVVQFLGDDFFGYNYCGFFKYNSALSKWELVAEKGICRIEFLNIPEFNGNAVLEDEYEYFNFFELFGNSYMTNISVLETDKKFSKHDFSFLSLFTVLVESMLNMKFADKDMREKMIENSNIHHSDRIINSLNEEKISFVEAFSEIVNVLNIDASLFAKNNTVTDELKIVISNGVNVRSWHGFLKQTLESEDHFNEQWLILPMIDDYSSVYGVTAFMLSNNQEIKSIQERILESIIPRFSTIVSQKKLHKEAMTDELTGAYNRRYIMKLLEEKYKKSNINPKNCFSVAMLDIDNFKTVNDTYGHQAGDLVLKNVVNSLNKTLREVDVIGRFGGEEFLIIISAEKEIAAKVCERIRKAVEKQHTLWEGIDIWITVSIGCVSSGDKTQTLNEMIALSDICLYEAKKTGKNRVVEFSIQ